VSAVAPPSCVVEGWYDVAERQAGMLAQRQLTELAVTRSFVRNQLRARRWAQRTSSVFSITTGPLSRPQLLWRAVLHAGPTAMVGALTAAEIHGLQRWPREQITVIVDDELSFEPWTGIGSSGPADHWVPCARPGCFRSVASNRPSCCSPDTSGIGVRRTCGRGDRATAADHTGVPRRLARSAPAPAPLEGASRSPRGHRRRRALARGT